MNGNEALLKIHQMQSNLWGMQEAAKFARQAGALLSTDDSPAIATIVTCPNEECVNGYIPKQHNCWEHGYSDEGCPDCNWLGYTAPKCEQCKGEGQVLMYKDGHTEVLI